MRVVVVGAGAVGGTLGGFLAEAGHDVTFVDRGAHLEALQTGGLDLETPEGRRSITAPAAADASALDPADLVILAVRSYDVAAAVPSLAPLVGQDTAILPLAGGVTAADAAVDRYGPEGVLGGVVYLNAAIVEPGHVRQDAGPRRLILGELAGGRSSRVEELEAVFEAAGIDAVVAPDVRAVLWSAYLSACAFGGLSALARADAGDLLTHPSTRGLLREAMEEVADVGRARGIAIGQSAVDDALATLERIEPRTRPAMLRDLDAGRPLEVNEMNGQVDRWGRELGVPTPTNHVVARLLAPRAGGVGAEAPAIPEGREG